MYSDIAEPAPCTGWTPVEQRIAADYARPLRNLTGAVAWPSAQAPPDAATLEAAGTPGTPVLDPSAFKRLLNAFGDLRSVQWVLDAFVADLPATAQALDDAAASGDLDRLGRAAHALGAGAQTLGAARLARLCARIETATVSGVLDGVPALIERVDAECRRVRLALAGLGEER